ncbi:hypothetical protein [Clostridium polynesiense]|uniref:hypothetical protein n=1 Tax=Clostridium polynesiense TaxID=1325933 RepID=UPI000590B717|nr:hypothetical protein [Clostridium polynesiense]
MFIKSILKEMMNKKFSNILIIIQLVITIILLVYCYDSIRMLNYPQQQLKSILGNDYKNIYQLKIKKSSDSEEFADMFNKFDSRLKNLLDSENIGAFNLTNTQFDQLDKMRNS